MTASVFADTNVIVYLVATVPDELSKRKRAYEILTAEDYGVSSQVTATPGFR